MAKRRITPIKYILELFDMIVGKDYPTGWFRPNFNLAVTTGSVNRKKKNLRRVAQIINYWHESVKNSPAIPGDIKAKLLMCCRRFQVPELMHCNSRYCPWCHSRFQAEARKLWADLDPVATIYDVGAAGKRPELATRRVVRKNLMFKVRTVVKFSGHPIEAEQSKFNIFELHIMSSYKNVSPERRKQIAVDYGRLIGGYEEAIKFRPAYILGPDFSDYQAISTGLKRLQRPSIKTYNDRLNEIVDLIAGYNY